jgi:hypothetical protein
MHSPKKKITCSKKTPLRPTIKNIKKTNHVQQENAPSPNNKKNKKKHLQQENALSSDNRNKKNIKKKTKSRAGKKQKHQ